MDFQYEQDDSIKQRSNPIRSPAAASENTNGGFDCNICLESALDPVVTLCGHLYCWPCIYKWLQVQNSAAVDSTDRPKCPVCKTSISHSSVVPLYGRGSSSSSSETRKRLPDSAIPQRPSAIGTTTSALPISAASAGSYPHPHPHPHPYPPPPPNPHHQLHPNLFNPQQPPYFQPYFAHSFGGYAPMGQQGIGNTTMTSFYSPTIGMFGEMVFSGIFGSSGPNWFATNHPMYSSPRRVRRQEMQVEKSLWRFFMFLVCFSVLCLLLF